MAANSINVYLGTNLKAKWEAHCRTRNIKAGAVLKEVIIKQMKTHAPENEANYQSVVDKPDEGQKIKKEVRLTPSEWASIEQRAAAEGSSVQHWMNCAIRASLIHEPQFTRNAVQALSDSSYQLLAIGRNLNQITKQMNQQLENASPSHKEIEILQQMIKEHMRQVSLVVSASASRWKIRQVVPNAETIKSIRELERGK